MTIHDRLKFGAQIILPCFGTLYFWFSIIYELPATKEVIGITLWLVAFFGIFLSSSKQNNSNEFDGTLEIEQRRDGTKNFTLNLDGDPEKLEEKTAIRFKVKPLEKNE